MDESITLTDDALKFQGKSSGKEYTVDIEFLKPVDSSASESIYKVQPRGVHFLLMKKDTEEEFWPRLLKDKAKEKNQVKIDWDRYVDEDEEDEGFDTSGLEGGQNMMGGMPGMGGMGGMGGGMDIEALMKQVSDKSHTFRIMKDWKRCIFSNDTLLICVDGRHGRNAWWWHGWHARYGWYGLCQHGSWRRRSRR
jgi:hypothetical protein